MSDHRADSPPVTSAPLEALLCDLFGTFSAFHRFVRDLPDSQKIINELPPPDASDSLAQLMYGAISKLEKAGFIDSEFFTRLGNKFKGKREIVIAEAKRWGISILPSPPLGGGARGALGGGGRVIVSLALSVAAATSAWWFLPDHIPDDPLNLDTSSEGEMLPFPFVADIKLAAVLPRPPDLKERFVTRAAFKGALDHVSFQCGEIVSPFNKQFTTIALTVQGTFYAESAPHIEVAESEPRETVRCVLESAMEITRNRFAGMRSKGPLSVKLVFYKRKE